jgi:hypothetical protein
MATSLTTMHIGWFVKETCHVSTIGAQSSHWRNHSTISCRL